MFRKERSGILTAVLLLTRWAFWNAVSVRQELGWLLGCTTVNKTGSWLFQKTEEKGRGFFHFWRGHTARGGAYPKPCPGLAAEAGLELRASSTRAESFLFRPPGCLGRTGPGLHATLRTTVRRFAAHSADPQYSPLPNSLMGTNPQIPWFPPQPLVAGEEHERSERESGSPKVAQWVWEDLLLHSGATLRLLAFVGSVCWQKRGLLCGRRTWFPCQAPVDWVLRMLLPNTQLSGYSSQSIRAWTGRKLP